MFQLHSIILGSYFTFRPIHNCDGASKSYGSKITIMNKLLQVSTLASLAMAMPGEINNVNRVSGFLNPSWVGAWPDSAVEVAYPSHTASWPGATVSVTRGKRSAGGFTVEGNTNQVSGSSPFPIYNAAWPGATVSVTHGKKKRSAPVVNNVNRVSGSSPFPIYTAAWPGATVSVTHGKKKRSAPVVALVDNVNQVSGSSPFPTYTAAWPGANVIVDHGK